MGIQVLVETINENDLTQILNYYNLNKLPNEQPLELLDRYEGGFKINIDNIMDKFCDDNKRIKQLRWNRGFLVSHYYIPFTKSEEKLLFDALAHVLGNEIVIYN
jgi:hypothetical protein